jgi:hypothetical protein
MAEHPVVSNGSEVGVEAASYPALNRRLPGYAEQSWWQKLTAACTRTPR